MRLSAKLTTGWPDDQAAPLAAPVLDEKAGKASNYERSLTEQLAAVEGGDVLALEGTFRRRPGGARALSRVVAGLANADAPGESAQVCRIDAFAYGFLCKAKNLDLVLPAAGSGLTEFLAARAQWSKTIDALEEFERTGEPLRLGGPITRERYLAMRSVIARPTARDERRSLTALLLSGPSTLEDLSADLGLGYTLGTRTVGVFESDEVGVVERREGGEFALRADTLGLVLFCLRETMGVDALSSLPDSSR